MNPRFDVFRKQNDRFIKWVGTAESLKDLEKLIRTDSGNASQEDYLIYRSAYGVTGVLRDLHTARLISFITAGISLRKIGVGDRSSPARSWKQIFQLESNVCEWNS